MDRDSRPERPASPPIDFDALVPPLLEAYRAVRSAALRYPESTEHHPWGETAIKVRGKAFVFLGAGDVRRDGTFGLSVTLKLPETGEDVLALPFAEPAGYGLARGGWVWMPFGPGDEPPVELLVEWLRESYRAVAPRRVLAAAGLTPAVRARLDPPG